MKISKTSKIGIVLAISLMVLVWGINFLKGRDILRTEKVYIARYKNVGGLEVSTVVQLNGLKIGYVREIYFSDDLSGDLIVKIAVFNKFPLPVGTTAEIANNDLLGSKVVKLSLGKSSQFYQHNDTIKTKIESDLMSQVTEQIAPIKAKAERLIVSLDSIVSGVSILLNSESRRNIEKSLKQISLTMENLEQISSDLSIVVGTQKTNLSASIVNLKELTENLNKDSKALGKILNNFSAISDSINPSELNSIITHLNKSTAGLETILSNINNSNGTLGLLVKDSTLYNQLAESGENLNRLLVDLKINPHRYLKIAAFNFGKEVYLAPGSKYKTIENIDFKVFLFSSNVQIPLESSIFQGIKDVKESIEGSKFLYFAGEDKSYDKIRMILNKVQLSFPQATLKAYQNKDEISLKKALKICSK
ncbi:MAG: MlaD family protein [Prolixibacteraceae bacterium]|nr:MlaD family protein [Prolixibacteraceae bacterium]